MKITPEIKRYKETVSTLNVKELLAVLNNSRLSRDERFVVELIDLYGKSIKEASFAMNMMYSDYYKSTYAVDRYAEMAKDFLLDADAPKDKLKRYMEAMSK